MAKCDLCGASCKPMEMTTLRDSYATRDVVDLCPSCGDWANKTKDKMISDIGPLMRAAVSRRHTDLIGLRTASTVGGRIVARLARWLKVQPSVDKT